MKTTNYAGPVCPHCKAVYIEGQNFEEHVATCDKRLLNREHLSGAIDRNVAELQEVFKQRTDIQNALKSNTVQVQRLIYLITRDNNKLKMGHCL